MTTPLAIDGNSLTLQDVVRVARDRAAVALDDGARSRMQRVRDVVDRKLASGEAVYGVCLLYTSPSPRDRQKSRMPSSA